VDACLEADLVAELTTQSERYSTEHVVKLDFHKYISLVFVFGKLYCTLFFLSTKNKATHTSSILKSYSFWSKSNFVKFDQ
jgi:hypothetical protein